MRIALIASVALAGCGWNLPDNGSGSASALWDPSQVLPVQDGVYVRLNAGGQLMHVTPEGATQVDLGAGSVSQMAVTPDGQRLVAIVQSFRCEAPDPREIRGVDRVEDCPARYLQVNAEVAVIQGGDGGAAPVVQIPVSPHYNALTFSADGRWAIAWLDADKGLDLSRAGVVDLTSVLVLDLQATGADAATAVSVGFGADRVLFTDDGSKAIVLSQDAVASVDLSSGSPVRGARYALTLDPDQSITPVGVQLTQDGQYALITAEESDDLYALRLERPAINLVNLSGTPSAMAVVPDLNDDTVIDDVSVVVHATSGRADVVSHDTFDVETFDLDEGMDRIEVAGRRSVLWSQAGNKDVYVLDHDTDELVEYRLQNPPVQLEISPGGEFAVALTRPEGGFGDDLQSLYDQSAVLEILEVGSGRGRSAGAKLLDGLGLGMAFDAGDGRLDLLVLQEGQDYLYKLDIYTDRAENLDITAPAVDIGTLPDGGFWISHDAGLGLISFYDPESDTLTEVGGFALVGFGDGTRLDDSEQPAEPTQEES